MACAMPLAPLPSPAHQAPTEGWSGQDRMACAMPLGCQSPRPLGEGQGEGRCTARDSGQVVCALPGANAERRTGTAKSCLPAGHAVGGISQRVQGVLQYSGCLALTQGVACVGVKYCIFISPARGTSAILCATVGGALRVLRSAQLQRTGPMRRLCCSMAQSPIASRASAAIEICAHQRRSSARGRGKAGRVNCQGTRTELLWKRGTGTTQQPFFTAFAWVSSEPVPYFVWRKVLRQGQRPNAARRAAQAIWTSV
jgi:hypothetical protein